MHVIAEYTGHAARGSQSVGLIRPRLRESTATYTYYIPDVEGKA